jgi:hypothetical protein
MSAGNKMKIRIRYVCRYYVSWRNASLNGTPLSDDALARLQLYAIPSSGRLRLDYVSYQVRRSLHRVALSK